MKSKEHTIFILTAAYRDGNLGKLAESIRPLQDAFDVIWLPIFDTKFGNWHAGAKYNAGLDMVAAIKESGGYHEDNSWLYFLDDDNLIHPEFGEALAKAICQANPGDWGRLMFIMDQYRQDNSPRIFLPRIQAMAIDTACVIPNASVASNLKCRWRMADNNGSCTFDYYYIKRLIDHGKLTACNVPGKVYYNALTGEDTGHRQFDKQVLKETKELEHMLYGPP